MANVSAVENVLIPDKNKVNGGCLSQTSRKSNSFTQLPTTEPALPDPPTNDSIKIIY